MQTAPGRRALHGVGLERRLRGAWTRAGPRHAPPDGALRRYDRLPAPPLHRVATSDGYMDRLNSSVGIPCICAQPTDLEPRLNHLGSSMGPGVPGRRRKLFMCACPRRHCRGAPSCHTHRSVSRAREATRLSSPCVIGRQRARHHTVSTHPRNVRVGSRCFDWVACATTPHLFVWKMSHFTEAAFSAPFADLIG